MIYDGPRLLAISVDAPPHLGGVAAFAHQCSNELSRLCKEFVFLGPRGTCAPSAQHINYKIVEDFKSRPSSRTGASGEAEVARISKLLWSVIDRYRLNRILLFHPFYYGPAAIKVGQELGIKVDVVVHGTELTSQFPEAIGSGSTLREVAVGSLPFNLQRTLWRSNRILANSRFTRMIANNIIGESRALVCGCGISDEALKKGEANKLDLSARVMRRLAVHGDEAPSLCFVGRLVKHKRVVDVLDLMRCGPWRLDVVGEGPDRESLQAVAANAGLASRVKFHGAVADERKWEVIAMSDFLVLPSRLDPATGGYEGFGLVLLEAIAAGVIPVASGSDGLADPLKVYGLGVEGLSQEVSVEDTEHALVSLLADADAYRAKADADLQTVKSTLTWANVARNIVSGWRQ